MRSDDDSYNSNTSKSRGSRSLPGVFAIDWDEIDSIAEESLSVCSSASSGAGHRKRKNAVAPSNRLFSSQTQLEAMESGSRSGFSASGSRGRSISSSTSCNRSGSSKRNGASVATSPRRTMKRSEPITRLSPVKMKQLAMIGGLCILATASTRFFGPFMTELLTSRTLSMHIGDRSMRRLLTKTTFEHNTRHWPVSVRDEENDFELITHPGNAQVTLSVPRFFLTKDDGSMQTLSHGKRMNRPLADMVGRTTVEGSVDFSVRTIFVGIASFRDWHCRYTIESMFSRAKYPERIRLAVVDQFESGEDQSCDVPIVPCQQKQEQALCQYRSQIDVYEMDANLAVGPTFARHVVNRMYRGEYYNLQIDAHTVFVKNWDVDLIVQLESTGNDMAVISTYLDDALGSMDDMSGTSIRKARQVICNAAYEGAGHERSLRHASDAQPNVLPSITGTPQLQPFWAAGFSFSRGHFVLSVPYDSNLPMLQREDEEISMGIRAFTHGYDFYTPERHVCFDSSYSDRESRKSFLEHKDLYKGLEAGSQKRMRSLLGMELEKEVPVPHDADELFSIGEVRDLSKFWNSFGVHVRERITERKLCNFVTTGSMHKRFHEFLKADGMGLDYSKINFRFHELQNNHDA